MYLTDQQFSRLRARPHRTRLWLSIYRPQVVFATQINQAGIAKGARDITVTNLSGSHLSALSGMTVYIGTTQGSKDIGRIRLRSATANTLSVAENAISWVNGWFLTVVRYFEPWGVFPRIVLDDDNVPVFYKDYDIAYANQNQNMDPVICMGPNHAGFLTLGDAQPTGTHLVWYTSSGSYNPTPGGTLSSYQWHFEGGNPTGSTAAHPGWVTYTGAGQYVTSLTIQTSEGVQFTGRRHISILARPDEPGPFHPVSAWGLTDLEGSRESGGYEGTVWVREPVNPEDIVDGALVLIFSESYEGGVQGKIGANAENRGEMFFCGYILEDSIRYDAETRMVDFNIGGITARMSELFTFSHALDDKRNASSWTDLRLMTLDRAMVHFLRWHSTVLAVTDFCPTNDADSVEFIDFERGDLYDSVSQLVGDAVIGQVVADRQGKIWSEVNASLQPTGTSRQVFGHMQSVIEVTRQDWRGEISIDRRPDGETSYVELGGIAYSGPITGTTNAYLSGAPGAAPDYFGSAERVSGLIITSQDQLNVLSGLAFAKANPLYPNVSVPLAGDYRFLDIAPQQRVEMTVQPGDTFRQISWSRKPFIPESITFEYQADAQVLLMDVELAEETHGPPGDTVLIPVEPPYDNLILPDWDIDFPPIIPPNPEIPPVEPPPGPGNLVYMLGGGRIFRSRNFGPTGTTWGEITPDWIGTNVTGTPSLLRLSPNDPLNTAYLLTKCTHRPYIYRINNLNAATGSIAYTEILEPTDLSFWTAWSLDQASVYDFSVSPISENLIWVVGRNNLLGQVRVAKTLNAGGSWVEASGTINQNLNANNWKIIASSKSIADAVIKTSAVWMTLNQGSTWTRVINAGSFYGVHDLHVPEDGNPSDQIYFYGNQNGANPPFAWTIDRGSTNFDLRPLFDGNYWGFDRSGGNHGVMDLVLTHPLDGNAIIALLQRDTPAQNNPTILFLSANGAYGGSASFFPRYQFPRRAWPIAWHATNVLVMAAISAGGGGDDNAIWSSRDGGLSFTDITSTWEASFGEFDSLFGSGERQIMFVWTA